MKKACIASVVLALGATLLFMGCQQTAVTSAKVYMQQNNWDKAIEQCNLAIASVPNDPDAYFVLGQAYGEKGLYQEMFQAFNKSLEYSPKYSTLIEDYKNKYYAQLFNSGVSLIKQNQYEQAVNNFKTCNLIFPNRMDAYINLGYTYTFLKNDSAATEVYKKAVQVDTANLEVRSLLGMMYYKTKQYDKAIEALKPVIGKAKPDSKQYMDALYYTAYSYDLLRQIDKAIETYTNALNVSPGNKDLLFNLGRLHIIKEDFSRAADYFAKVLESDPNDFDANFNTGICFFQQKKYDAALPYLQKSVELKPDNTQAWANLVVALDQSSNKNSETYRLIGKGLLQLDKAKDAIPYLKKSVGLQANNAPAWELLLEAYTKAGLTKEVRETQKKLDALRTGK